MEHKVSNKFLYYFVIIYSPTFTAVFFLTLLLEANCPGCFRCFVELKSSEWFLCSYVCPSARFSTHLLLWAQRKLAPGGRPKDEKERELPTGPWRGQKPWWQLQWEDREWWVHGKILWVFQTRKEFRLHQLSLLLGWSCSCSIRHDELMGLRGCDLEITGVKWNHVCHSTRVACK